MYTRDTRGYDEGYKVNFMIRLPKTTRAGPFSLMFNDQDALNVHDPHDNAIVIAAQVANYMVF